MGLILQVSARENAEAADETGIAGVFQTVEQLRSEMDLIRLEMGKSEAAPPLFRAEKAAPREIYFQAVALFRKADRLAFEHTREQVKEVPPPAGEIGPEEVQIVVEAALSRIKRVKESMGIPEITERNSPDPDVDPSRLFNSIAAANRELNLLLDQQLAPQDVFRQVSVAISLAARLLDSPTETSSPPEAPPRERRKRPQDVFLQLGDCFDLIRLIGLQAGVEMLVLTFDDTRMDQTQPGDVYDLASLLVAELSHLHGLKANARPPRPVYDPGRKLPSEVYQRVGILRQQLEALREKAGTQSNWLKE